MQAFHISVLGFALLGSCYCNNASIVKAFDYVIVGGGTCGLVLANRLSENPYVSVAVIEAGGSAYNNPNVTIVGAYGLGYGTSVDWFYNSTKQSYSDNRIVPYHSGRGLGGTSLINGMTYVRAEKAQIDGWETLGSPGWNWTTLFPYYLKSETFQSPTPAQVFDGATYNASFHGNSGPLTVGWMDFLLSGKFESLIQSAWINLGFPHQLDTSTGHLRGFNVWPLTLNRKENIRTDAARAYYWPIVNRSNLITFDNTLARRIVWNEDTERNGTVCAKGVEVVTSSGSKETVFANKEVILSAGSLRSPALLEASGIGNPRFVHSQSSNKFIPTYHYSVLQEHGIPLRVPLPGVGENLQDQINTEIADTSYHNFSGYPPYVTYATAADLFGADLSGVETYVRRQIPGYASVIAAQASNSTTRKTQEQLLGLQADFIFKHNIAAAEILTPVGSTNVATVFWGLLPFSRGSAHLRSFGENEAPTSAINPNFFMIEWDSMLQAATARLSRKALSTAPLSNLTIIETVPGLSEVPQNATDAVWTQYFKKTFTPNSHPCCTAPMMKRELGGVLDPDMRVYGTSNVRVIDASSMPYQVNGHLTSTLYAMAEKAADVIKAQQ